MITGNKRIRFCENNFVESSTVTGFSSELASFPFSNLYLDERTKLWKPSGCFEISGINNKLHINDGADKTATISVGKYATPNSLATEIQTQLNTVSSGFTVTYESTYKFKIARGSSFTLRLSVLTDSIAPSMGFNSVIDITGLSALADSVAIHTSEWVTFDLGFAASVDFIAMIGPIDEIFTLSPTASIKAYANNINDFSAPALVKTLTRLDGGVMNFIDDADSSFRYWKIEIIDKDNYRGPQCFAIGNLYLGDYQTLTSRNLENGFTIEYQDNSIKTEAESGALFFDKKPKTRNFGGMSLGYLSREDKKTFTDLFQKLGLSTPFYISLDPTGCFSDNLDELTIYCRFDSEPQARHVIRDVFSISISATEVV